MRFNVSSIVFLACVVAACGNSITGADETVTTGVWGGNSIQMTITDKGAAIEHECDSGKIDQPLLLNHSGQFSTDGTYTFGHGGPRQIGEPPAKAYPARYSGTIAGTSMKLSVFIPELSRSIDGLTLELGKPMLNRCL